MNLSYWIVPLDLATQFNNSYKDQTTNFRGLHLVDLLVLHFMAGVGKYHYVTYQIVFLMSLPYDHK